jgi:hypothetical protein
LITLPPVDTTARLQHEAWRVLVGKEVESRLSFWGEELLVPWENLSERAREYNREWIRRLYNILDILSPEVDLNR